MAGNRGSSSVAEGWNTNPIDLQGPPVSSDTDGGILKGGNSTSRIVSAVANQKMVSLYFDLNGGGQYGLYVRSYFRVAGQSSDAARFFGTVQDVAGGTHRGAHISLSFGTSGTVTGLAAALECTLHMPSGGGMAGTNYAIKAAINSDGANADPAGATTIGVIGMVAQGTQGGLDDLDDDGVFFDISGFTAGAAHMLNSTSLAELPANSIALRIKVNGALYYIPAVIAAELN